MLAIGIDLRKTAIYLPFTKARGVYTMTSGVAGTGPTYTGTLKITADNADQLSAVKQALESAVKDKDSVTLELKKK